MEGPTIGHNWEELQALTHEQVEERFNQAARHSDGGLNFWHAELWRRYAARQNERAEQLMGEANSQTHSIKLLTLAVVILTIVVVGLTLLDVWLAQG